MGWAYGIAYDGREIGYTVKATCDMPGCDAKIDRGVDHLCDGPGSGLEVVMGGVGRSCGKYYCGAHNYFLDDGDETCPHKAEPVSLRQLSAELGLPLPEETP